MLDLLIASSDGTSPPVSVDLLGLISPTLGASTEVLDLLISSGTDAGPPVDVDLLGLHVTTSNIHARLLTHTGEGQLLGNLVYNAANLLNPGSSTTLLLLLAQLARLA